MMLPKITDWLLGRTALSPREILSPGGEKADGQQVASLGDREEIILDQNIPNRETSNKPSDEKTAHTKGNMSEDRARNNMGIEVHGTVVVKLPTEYGNQPITDHIVSLIAMPISDFDRVILQYTLTPEDEKRSSVTRLLSSLCLELLTKRPHLFDEIRGLNSAVRQAVSTSASWTESIMFLYLKIMLCSLPQCRVICVLQLLEPLGGQKAVLDIITRLNTLTTMTEMGMGLLVIVPTSINVPSYLPTFSLKAEMAWMTDNSILLSSLVQSRPALAAVKDEIALSLGRFADFQLSQCYVQHLTSSQCINRKSVSMDDHIVVSPSNFLERLMPNNLRFGYEWVSKAVMWLSVCIRTLSLNELATALALECRENGFTFNDSQIPLDIEHDLRQALPGLVCIEGGMVKLGHPAFRDLIVQDQETLPSWCRGKSSHSQVAACCLEYLKLWGSTRYGLASAKNSSDNLPETETETMPSKASQKALVKGDSSSWPLLQYASEYWFQHHAKAINTASLGKEFPADLLADPKTMDDWVEQYLASTGSIGKMPAGDEAFTPLQLAKQHEIDIPTAVELFLYARTLLGCQSANDIAELLCVATEFGFEEAVAALRQSRQNSDILRESYVFYKAYRAGMSSAFALLADIDPAFVIEHRYELLLIDIQRGESQVLDYLSNSSLNNMTVPMDSTFLHEACQLGHINIVERLVRLDKFPPWLETASEPDGYTPLHLAVLYGHSDVVEELLKRHANPNVVNLFGDSPLITAARLGLLSIVSKLLQNGDVNPAIPNKKDQTSLHIASTKGYGKICSLLVQSGLSIYTQDQNGDNSLHLALKNGHGHLVDTFFNLAGDDGAKPSHAISTRDTIRDPDAGESPDLNSVDAEGNSALAIAIENNLEAAAQLLISSGANLNIQNTNRHTPLMLATRHDCIGLVRILLANHADPNLTNDDGGGESVLHIAAFLGNTNIVQELLRHADTDVSIVDDDGNTPLTYALYEGHSEVFVELLKHCSKQLKLDSLILSAAELDDERPITQLLDAGANKNFQDDCGNTALHCAAYSDCSEVVRVLLTRCVDLELKDDDGNTAFSDAARMGSVKSLVMLLNAGANLNTENNRRRTPLHQAAFADEAEAVKILILRGSEMAPTYSCAKYPSFMEEIVAECSSEVVCAALSAKSGGAAYARSRLSNFLLLAAQSEDPKTVGVILDYGADPNEIMNDKFGTALNRAAYNCNLKMAKRLLEHPENPADTNVCAGKYGTALHSSLCNDSVAPIERLKMISYLLERGANPKIQGKDPIGTILHAAIRVGPEILAKLVLERTEIYKLADIADDESRYPIHIAAWKGHKDVFDQLLNRAPDTSLSDKQGRLPIHFAAAGGQFEILKALLRTDAPRSINIADKHGWTPLHWSCRQDNPAVVKFLLHHGADRALVATSGKKWTATHVAVYHDKASIAHLLGSTVPDSAEQLPARAAECVAGRACGGCLCVSSFRDC